MKNIMVYLNKAGGVEKKNEGNPIVMNGKKIELNEKDKSNLVQYLNEHGLDVDKEEVADYLNPALNQNSHTMGVVWNIGHNEYAVLHTQVCESIVGNYSEIEELANNAERINYIVEQYLNNNSELLPLALNSMKWPKMWLTGKESIKKS
jgi:hypothetical protein